MRNKSEKQQEKEGALFELHLLWKILTNEQYARAFAKEVEDFGNFGTDMIRVLQGKEPERKWL